VRSSAHLAVGHRNRYIALTPGPNNAEGLPANALLDTDKTTPIVDLDQLFNTLDPDAREDLQNVIQGSAQQFEGKGEEANEAAGSSTGALDHARARQRADASTRARSSASSSTPRRR
jgi:phospholipid/cholesterol/gamma-HCH transport system substrate-binding protein